MEKSRRQFEVSIKLLSDLYVYKSKCKRTNNKLSYARHDIDLM